MTYNVFGGTLNLAQFNSIKFCHTRLFHNIEIYYVCVGTERTNIQCFLFVFVCDYVFTYYQDRICIYRQGKLTAESA